MLSLNRCLFLLIAAERELQERLRDPVIAADGHTYERAAMRAGCRGASARGN